MTLADATRIAKGSTYLVTQSIVDAAIRAIALAFVARTLTETEMGIVVALVLISTLAQMLSDLGFSRALSKYVAEYRGRNTDYSPFLSCGISIKLLTGGLAAVVCAVAAPQLSQLLLKTSGYSGLFQLLSIYVLFFCLNLTMTGLLLGLDRIREMAISNVVLTLIAQTSGVTLLMSGYGLTGLVTGWTLGQLAYLITSALIIAKGKELKKHSVSETGPFLRTLAKFSWPLFLTNIVVFVYNSFDRVILLAYLSLSEVGVYSVALRVFSALSIVPAALSTTLFPYYSEQYGGNKRDNILVGVRAATRYTALVYLPLALGLAITANPAISIVAGHAYTRGDVILTVLCLFGAVGGLSAALDTLLLVYGMTPTILLINIASVGGSVAFSPILLSTLGATGMAIVKGVTMIISLTLTVFVLRRRMRIEFDKEALWKGCGAAIIMVVVVGLIEWMFFNPYLLPLYMVVGGVVYAVALKILRVVNEKDMLLIETLMGKRATSLVKVLKKVLM